MRTLVTTASLRREMRVCDFPNTKPSTTRWLSVGYSFTLQVYSCKPDCVNILSKGFKMIMLPVLIQQFYIYSAAQKKPSHFTTNYLTPWSRVLPEKLTSPQLDKKFPTFYQTRGCFTSFTKAFNCPSPQPDQSNPCLPILRLEGLL